MTHESLGDVRRPQVMVTGSRGWTDEDAVWVALDNLLDRLGPFDLLHGRAKGADTAAYWWALDREDISGYSFLPDYKTHGKRAPHVRNDKMLDRATYVLAFWDGKSRGTKSVIDKAIRRDLEWEVHAPEGVEIGV